MLLALLLAVGPSPVEFIGFSAGDKYAAWIDHGTADGSGFPWASLHVQDVAKNAPALSVVTITLEAGAEGDSEEAAVAKVRASLQEVQEKLGVAEWLPAREIAHDEKGELTDHEGAPIGTLELKSRKAAKGCGSPFKPLLLKAVISFLDDDKPATLADEKKPPRERPCSTGCALDRVFAHGKAALLFIKCGVPGFEGPASKLSTLSGVLPYGLDEPLPEEK